MKLIAPNGPVVSKANELRERRGSRVYSKRPRYDPAKEAAIEKERARYVLLNCGHKTTWQIDEFYSLWRPDRHKSYCEQCGKWVQFAPKPAPINYPDNPLF